MFRDRIVPHALRTLQSKVITPVIIEVHSNYFRDVLKELSEYVTLIPRRLVSIEVPELPIHFPQILGIPTFNMIAAVLPREVVFDYAEDSRVVRIYPDEIKYALQYPTVPPEGIYKVVRRGREVQFTTTKWTKKLVGCDVANEKGFTGRGVKVSVLDTGVSILHEQIRGRVETYSAFITGPQDVNGHGTWCVSCISGRRTVDYLIYRTTGQYVEVEGMAPDADIVSVKVLDYVVGLGSDSSIIKGLEIAVTTGSKVISMSLGGPENSKVEEDSIYYRVFKELVSRGVIPVVASGNEGPESGSVCSPGTLTDVLTVGATDPITGTLAEYSSRGPTPWNSIKPDVVAPGGGYPDRGIHSAVVGALDTAGDGIKNRYSPIQGTSMATPHVAGLIACAVQMYRNVLGMDLTVEEVKRMMESLGHDKNNDDGWGFISWSKFEEWVSTQYGVTL